MGYIEFGNTFSAIDFLLKNILRVYEMYRRVVLILELRKFDSPNPTFC